MKKAFAIVVTALLCAFGLAALSACSAGDEDAIREDCQQTLESTYDKDLIATAFRSVDGVSILEDAGLDVDALAETIAGSLKYEVTDVEVDGDAATATVELTYPDLGGDEAQSLMEEKLAAVDTSGIAGVGDIVKAYQDVIAEMLADEDMPTATKSFDVPYEKSGGSWQMKDKDRLDAVIGEIAGSAAQ